MGSPPHLELLATIVAGRPVSVAVDVGAGRAWSDGTTVFVRPGPEMRAEVVAQAALLAVGTVDSSLLRSFVRRPRLLERYLGLESRRALAYLRSTWPQVPLPADASGPQETESPAESLGLARRSRRLPRPAPVWGRLRPARVASAEPAVARMDASTPAEALEQLEREALQQTVESEGATLPKIMNTRRSTVSFRRSRNWSLEAAPGATASLAADFATARRGDRATGVWVPTRIRSDDDPPVPPSDGTTFPEWDARRRRYNLDWCRVRTVTPVATPRSVTVGHAGDEELRRALLPVGLGLARRTRTPYGDSLDLDAAIVALSDRAAGCEPSPRVHVARVPRRRDLSVVLLLDVSGSAGDPSSDGRTVHEHQAAAATALTSALDTLGARTAVQGFRSNGRTDIEIVRVKDFAEPFGGTQRARLASLAPSGHTRLGAAVRHATRLLELDGSNTNRLLVVLSDGFAYDIGYEGTHAKADTRHALLEARRAGIGCLCLTIAAPESDEALREVFGSSAHARAHRLEDLGGDLRRLFIHALGLAEQSRRRHRQEVLRA